ncbi:DNA-processing protein DprA [Comamonas sp. 26]|uniref:DNA-processing protein DprA n=1 Tax=Comamonas sp. 26 TaxID=2035201 RepID=UPI000C19C0A0|nr:DNA-processing protein DprA [Comamonas sp. 26]PIG07842.1 DNA processing protein [Comamonas sp. 26]
MGWAISEFLAEKPIDIRVELGAYEFLWQQKDATTKRLAELFDAHPGKLPSELVDEDDALKASEEVLSFFSKGGVSNFGIRINGSPDYPERLRDAPYPVELLYFLGTWELAEAPRRVAVVGTREVSTEGASRTRKLVRQLVENDFTIVSGLAKGVDTIAHETAIAAGGRTVAVIGTPISEVYPKENAYLQHKIAHDFLLVSQVPVLRYKAQGAHINRFFFPERNKTMSALSEATIIVEASETSGTLIQARAALEQGRKLFILESNFHNPAISWPAKYEAKGAIRVKSVEDILKEF